jgi:CubicO group peptidase (beta-lactamase class C family)
MEGVKSMNIPRDPIEQDRQSAIPPSSGAVRRGVALGLALLILGLTGCVPHQTGTNQCPDINHAVTGLKDNPFTGMPSEVDTLIAAYLAAPGAPPGCAVGIMQNNSVAFLKGYGLADLENNKPFTVATPSVLASVSKTWTALAVLRLSELGFLGLDDKVSNHISVPSAWSEITVRQLLSHTSGIQRDPTFHPGINNEVKLSQFLFPFLNVPILNLGIHPKYVYYSYLQSAVPGFEPGATARYSNTGYMILGALIDFIASAHSAQIGASYESYEAFVWRQVGLFDNSLSNGDQMLTPCLNEYWRQTDILNLARGYTLDGGSYVHTTFFNSSVLSMGPAGWEGPAGGWTVTIGDLVRLMMAIQNDDIVSPASKAQMMTVQGSDSSGNWGLGVNRIQKLGLPVFMHDGAYPGFRARYTVWPNQGFGVAIMANESSADMRDITDAIAAVFLGTGVAPGAAGINAAGLSVAQNDLDRTEPIDDNDPGLAPRIGEEAPLPRLTVEERRDMFDDLRRLEQLQSRDQQQRLRVARLLDQSGCLELMEELVRDHGIDLVLLFAECFDASENHGEFTACVSQLLNDLARRGIITRQQRGRLQSCAAIWMRD